MKKGNYGEIVGVLSLSLILTSPLSVSSCLPEMSNTFSQYSLSSLELLMSIPAFSIMLMVAFAPVFLKFLSERTMIITGLLAYSIAGMIPAFSNSYIVILISRILMGVGIGMINTKAVSMIGERFTGNLQQRLQGVRCSMETLGQAALTLIAGQLLRFNWHYSFLIYSAALIILFIYLKFVPSAEISHNATNTAEKITYKISTKEWIVILQNCILGGILVSASVTNSLRLTSYITESGIGTDVNGATILSIATFVGFLGGLVFGNLMKTFKQLMLPFSMCLGAIGFITIFFSNHLIMVALGASICSFAITNATSFIFNRLSVHLPKEALDTGNSVVLVGCNLGSFTAPFILKVINVISPALSAGFLSYAVLFLMIVIIVLIRNGLMKKMK